MEKECKCCGKVFIADSHKRKYCSEKCRKKKTDEAVKKRYRERKLEEGCIPIGTVLKCKCKYCGKEFEYVYNRRKREFCNDKCSQRSRHEKIYAERRLARSDKKRKQYASTMNEITDAAVEARQLGLSYGQYIAYRDTGYLEHFKRMQFREKSERRADGRTVHFDSTKMEDNF